MLEDGFNMMLGKFSRDAKRELQQAHQAEERVREMRLARERLYRGVKLFFLGLALIGVGVGIRFGHELGKMLGELRYSPSAEADPTLRGERLANSKHVRKMKELLQQREAELAEIE
jgi:hypothetical protein